MSGVGSASMDTDRFAYLSPLNISFPAQVTMKPQDMSSVCAISANVNASGSSETPASFKLELLSETGYRVDGFSAANASAIVSNGLALPCTWGAGGVSKPPSGVVDPASRKVQRRFMLRAHLVGGAKIYALNLHAC